MESRLCQTRKVVSVVTLFGGSAHDFNNILSVVMDKSQLSGQGRKRQGNTGEIGNILDTSKRTNGMSGKLTNFSRTVEAEYKQLDFDREIASAVDMLKGTIPEMVRVESNFSAPSKYVMGDPGQLRQVILNLGANSAGAMPQGGRLEFETRVVDMESEAPEDWPRAFSGSGTRKYALLKVSDSGQVMDQATRGKSYGPLFSTMEPDEAAGPGLASVYGIVKGHQGYMRCESECGRGNSFSIFIPLSPGGRRAEVPVVLERKNSEAAGETVLVVDDEEAIRDIGRQVLENRGYQVLAASSGEEALELYRAHGTEIDLVVMDLGMPGMGGEECSRRIMELNPAVRLIVASGYSEKDELEDILNSEHRRFIAKPYRVKELLSLAREVLGD